MISKRQKILIVTETPPGTPNGFGITLKNLFYNLEYYVIYTDKSFYNKSYRSNYIFAHCPNHHSKKLLPLFILGLIPEWRGKFSFIWLFFFLRGKYHTVYSFFYSLDNLKFASWIASKKKAKHLVHIADHCESFFSNPIFEKIIKTAHKRACIGVNMQKTYESKFNTNFKVFHNYADSRNLPIKSPPKMTFSEKSPLKILFIGSIFKHLHHGSIQDLCQTVKELHSKGKPITFHMYGQVHPGDYLDDQIDNLSVFHHGEIEAKERFCTMENHHVFVVPSSFNKELSCNYSFSIPTKLPELIGSGRPTIVYGPSNMEAFRYCKNLSTGILIDQKDINKLKIIFNYLLENYDVEFKKAQSSVTRTASQIFGLQCQKEFSDFVLK